MLAIRAVALVVAVAVLVGWFGAGTVPTWLIVVAAASAIVLGFQAAVRQKRMERQLARRVWAALRRS